MQVLVPLTVGFVKNNSSQNGKIHSVLFVEKGSGRVSEQSTYNIFEGLCPNFCACGLLKYIIDLSKLSITSPLLLPAAYLCTVLE